MAKKSKNLRTPEVNLPSNNVTRELKNSQLKFFDSPAAHQVADLRRVIGCCSQEDSSYIATTAHALQQSNPSVLNTELLLECALYFESIGDFTCALRIAEDALRLASFLKEINLERRCHSIVGVVLSRQCDFGRALFHLEAALNIAKRISVPLYEFAVLCNIAATLPYMGLMRDAKNLSLKNLAYPDGTLEHNQLHLQNALNGIKLSQSLADDASLIIFNRLADRKINEVPGINSLTRAYYDAYHALSLLLSEKPSDAHAYVQEKIESNSTENIRAKSTLMVARAICAIKTRSQRNVKKADEGLTEILPHLRQTPFHYEDALRALVGLSKIDKRKSSQTRGILLARDLSEHLVNVKHRQFFDRLQYEDRRKERVELCAPNYSISTKLLPVAPIDFEPVSCISLDNDTHAIEVTDLDRVQRWIVQNSDSSRKAVERKLRSKEYDIAEEWALSADYFADRFGCHCLEVGALARLIALELGSMEMEAISIDLACRLHDIGKVLIDGTVQRNVKLGATDDYLVMREHTQMGSSLLGSSKDPLLALAASVARSHHEWWNGCGHPDSLAGENIPLAARICSVADNYIVLLRPSSNRLMWSQEFALQQIEAMSGVQLDPLVVRALVTAVGSVEGCSNNEVILSLNAKLSNRFVSARKSLVDIIA